MTAAAPARALTVEELQAAYDAARRGVFAGAQGGYVPAAPGGHVGGYGSADVQQLPTGCWPDRAVRVLAAHAGAGASIVALALAEALAEGPEASSSAGATGVHLVELGDPTRSGLAAAATAELGVTEGWRRGRRRRIVIDRPADGIPGDGSFRLASLLLDAGAPARVVLDLGLSDPAAVADRVVRLVLVCRPTVPGVRQAELALARLDSPESVVIAAPGRARWPGVVAASCGPLLRAARTECRVVAVPVDRRLELTGATGAPLPKTVAAAGRRLAALVFVDQPAAGRAG